MDRLLEAKDETIAELRDRVRYLEVESRRKDHLLAALEHIPTIEPPEPQESPESAAPASDAAEPRSATEEQQEQTARPQEERSW